MLRNICQFSVEELVNSLTRHIFERDDVRRAFETTERLTTAGTRAVERLDDESVHEDHLFKGTFRVETQSQSSADGDDPIFSSTESAPSMTQEMKSAVRNLSSSPARTTSTSASIITGDGMKHRSQADAEERRSPLGDAFSRQHYDKETPIDGSVACHCIDTSSSLDETSIAESIKPAQERSTHSTNIGGLSVAGSTSQNDVGSSSKASQQRSVLPLKLKPKSENRQRPSLEDEMSLSAASTRSDQLPRVSHTKKPNNDAQVVEYAKYGVMYNVQREHILIACLGRLKKTNKRWLSSSGETTVVNMWKSY